MNKKIENIIINFIKDEFPIKRIKNHKNKWTRAIVIPQGYVRKDKKIYLLNKRAHLNRELIASDIAETVSLFFGYNQQKSTSLVINYINSIRI